MADDLSILTQDGVRTVATHDEAGVHHQRNIAQGMDIDGAPVDLGATQAIDDTWGVHVRHRPVWLNHSFDFASVQTYTTGDCVGVVQQGTLSVHESAPTAWIDSIALVDATDTGPDLDVFIFGDETITVTDGAAFAPSDADLRNMFASSTGHIVEIAAADWYDAGGGKVVKVPINQALGGYWGVVSVLVVARAELVVAATTDLAGVILLRVE